MPVLETRGEMSVMGKEGDTKVIWNADNADEVENARRTFNDLRRKGFTAFSVKGDKGEKDRVITEFDAGAERIIMVPRVAGGADGAVDEDFGSIIREAIEQANAIRCPAAEYRAQLRSWIEDIRIAIEASEASE
jgi:hypothetical protein